MRRGSLLLVNSLLLLATLSPLHSLFTRPLLLSILIDYLSTMSLNRLRLALPPLRTGMRSLNSTTSSIHDNDPNVSGPTPSRLTTATRQGESSKLVRRAGQQRTAQGACSGMERASGGGSDREGWLLTYSPSRRRMSRYWAPFVNLLTHRRTRRDHEASREGISKSRLSSVGEMSQL